MTRPRRLASPLAPWLVTFVCGIAAPAAAQTELDEPDGPREAGTSEEAPAAPPPEEAAPAATEPAASDAPEAASPLPSVESSTPEYEVGFDAADGAYLRTRDRAWSIRIGLFGQFRFTVSSTPDPSREIEFVPLLARLYVQGSIVAPWVRYYFQTEFAGQQSPAAMGPVPPTPRLLDAWVEAQPHEAIGVRVGMLRPPFSRSWIAGLGKMLMFDRTDANAFFRNHGPAIGGSDPTTLIGPLWDRALGAYVFGAPADGLFEYYVGAFNGNSFLFGRNTSVNVMPMVRLAVNPLGRMAYEETPAVSDAHQSPRVQIAVSGYYNQPRVEHAGIDPMTMMPATLAGAEEHWAFEADASFWIESVYLSAELYYRNRQVVDGTRHDELGGMAVAGWMFWAPYLEVAARASFIDPNLSAASDFRQVYDVGLNVYPAQNNLKLELRYTIAVNDAPALGGVPNDVPAPVTGPVSPVVIPAGEVVHSVGLWGQLYF